MFNVIFSIRVRPPANQTCPLLEVHFEPGPSPLVTHQAVPLWYVVVPWERKTSKRLYRKRSTLPHHGTKQICETYVTHMITYVKHLYIRYLSNLKGCIMSSKHHPCETTTGPKKLSCCSSDASKWCIARKAGMGSGMSWANLGQRQVVKQLDGHVALAQKSIKND